MSQSPFLLPDHRDYVEILTDGAVHVLETTGVDRFSVAAIARWMKVSPEAIHNHYSRARVLDVVTIRFSRRWLHWSVGDPRWLQATHPCPLRLPRTAEERHGVVVFHAFRELARGERVRGNPLPMLRLAKLREDEQELLGSRVTELSSADIYTPVADVELRSLSALLAGLRSALAEDPPALSWEAACEQFARAASAVARPARDVPSTRSDLNPPTEPAA
jgi:AcrR family transcriptional regulator